MQALDLLLGREAESDRSPTTLRFVESRLGRADLGACTPRASATRLAQRPPQPASNPDNDADQRCETRG